MISAAVRTSAEPRFGDYGTFQAEETVQGFNRSVLNRVQALLREREKLRHVDDASEEPLKIVDLPKFEPLLQGHPHESFAAMQEWEGVVTKVSDGIIFADLIDVTKDSRTAEEKAEIPFEEISDSDRNRVVPGAIFRWVIGYLRKASGTKIRGSIIYFRRTTAAATSTAPAYPDFVFEEQNG
jgi:hypothetical protein